MLRTRLAVAAVVLVGAGLIGTGVGWWSMSRSGAGPDGADNAAGAQAEAGGKSDPPGVALEARLVAKKESYALDFGGNTPEQFRKLLQTGPYPGAPQVDAVLEFRTTGDREITFLVGGTNPDIPLLLRLDGPGAVNKTLPSFLSKMASFPPKQVALAPGKPYLLPIKSLRTNNVGRQGSASYWTGPGQYRLTATYRTAVSPAPAGTKEWPRYKGFGTVTLTSSPLRLKVTKAEQ
jgi:hypothetical protein